MNSNSRNRNDLRLENLADETSHAKRGSIRANGSRYSMETIRASSEESSHRGDYDPEFRMTTRTATTTESWSTRMTIPCRCTCARWDATSS